MEINELIQNIKSIDMVTNDYWLSTLDDRKKKEMEFHDKDRDIERELNLKAEDTFEKFYGNRKYYDVTKRSQEYVKRWIEAEAKGNIFLDYACGDGKHAMTAAKAGASLSVGLDISSISVENARQDASKKSLSNIKFFQADAENTKLPDNCVDRIICSGMLHHLDLSHALPEIRRILKPGGKVLAVEALDYNPLVKIYRLMTPEMRTEWEKAHILSLKDVEFAKRFFVLGEIKYWHVTGYVGGKIRPLKGILDYLDRFLERIPYVQRLGWMFTFELIKGK